jgi:streptogramin lyase
MRKYVRPLAAVAIALVALLMPIIGVALSAAAAPAMTEYPIPTSGGTPQNITAGPDGAIWFTEVLGNNIGRVTPSGSITEYPIPTSDSRPIGITSGPDGALWFTEKFGNNIGRISVAGVITEYPLPASYSFPTRITAGPDGALWFIVQTNINNTYGNSIARMTTSGEFTQYPITPFNTDTGLVDITVGPDGALWFTETTSGPCGFRQHYINRISTTGTVTYNPLPSGCSSPLIITVGPDGAFWFTEAGQNGNYSIGRFMPPNSYAEYPIPTTGSVPSGITNGPDGALWFTEAGSSNIGRIDTSGTIAEYPTPTPWAGPFGIVASPDGALWFTEGSSNGIGRISLKPSAPANLTAASPTQNPSLTWDSVSGAASYNIYRNGTKVGSSTTATYTDNSAPEGTDTYYVTTVNSAGESSPSNSVSILVDRTPPTISNVTLAQNPLATGSTTSVSATVADNLSGIAKAEYYIGKDPGQGNGTTMTISNGTATATVGPFSTAGIYTIYVRDQDSVGNWSQPVAVNADVYNPSSGYTAGHGFITPNGATSNPGDNLPAVSGPNVKATLDFTIKYASSTSTMPTGMSTFTWGSGNCKKTTNPCFVVTADTSVNPNALSWLVVPGDNTVTFQGIASVSLNGQTLGTDYVMRVNIIATTDTTPGHYELQVYQAGSNPDTSTPVYQASGDLTGGAVLVH